MFPYVKCLTLQSPEYRIEAQAALMRQESMFKPGAVSSANALGLMQLLHETARNEASLMGLPEPEARQLFDPELNIRLGVHHLKGLLEHHAHSEAKALAAYNAGKKAVERWTRNFASTEDVEFVERISYRETRRYVKAVLRNYHAYRNPLRRGPAGTTRPGRRVVLCAPNRVRRPCLVPLASSFRYSRITGRGVRGSGASLRSTGLDNRRSGDPACPTGP